MKRVWVVVAALIACLVVGSATVATAKKKKHQVKTRVTLAVAVAPANRPYGEGSGTFYGKVKSKKKCRRGRRVTIKYNGTPIGNTTSNKKGKYSFFSPVEPVSGTYVSKAHKKPTKIKKKGKKQKVLCKAAKSNPVVVP